MNAEETCPAELHQADDGSWGLYVQFELDASSMWIPIGDLDHEHEDLDSFGRTHLAEFFTRGPGVHMISPASDNFEVVRVSPGPQLEANEAA
jgi:hypothetical protein